MGTFVHMHSCTWRNTHTHSHTQAISLITSDRKAARGNGYSPGHFHCGALLALCPIYAFNTHTHKHTCVYIHIKMLSFSTHSHTHTHQCRNKNSCIHAHNVLSDKEMHQDACRDMEKENEITWLVVLSLTVIHHHGPNHMCSNRDKNRHICTPHTDRYAVVQWQVLGRRLLSILIACVF